MARPLNETIPTIWSPRLIVDVEKQFVFPNIANRDYEGEITGGGDVVKINEIGDVTVSTYTPNSSLTYTLLDSAQKQLVIDQVKSFSFLLDDVDRAQARGDVMSAGMQKASHAIADEVDQFLAGKYTEAGIVNSNIGTALSSGSDLDIYAVGDGYDHILGVITEMHKSLDESDAPTAGRWCVIPAWMHAYLRYAELVDNVKGAPKDNTNSAYGNGYIGNVLGFDFYASNNVKKSSTGVSYAVMFGTRDALSFASQVTEMETFRHPDYFATAVRGLYVYGAKVVRPDHLGVTYLAAAGIST